MRVLLPTDIDDPHTGEPLYVWHTPHGRLWHWYRRVKLFLGICWRRWDPACTRIDVATAWEVASIGFDRDVELDRRLLRVW